MMRRCLPFRCAAAATAATSSESQESVPKKKKAAAPLKTYDEYMAMDLDQIRKLNEIRTQQIDELKQLHERSHRNVEYFYRKQVLDYDEKSITYADVAGQMTMDQISYHRFRLGDLRQKNWSGGRDKGVVLWLCLIATVFWWLWLMAHYPIMMTPANKGRLQSTVRILGNPLMTDRTWAPRPFAEMSFQPSRLTHAVEPPTTKSSS
jgi:hypothetical protein